MKSLFNQTATILVLVSLGFGSATISANNLAPETIIGARTITTTTAKLLMEKGYPLIDVRSAKDFNQGHIPGAFHLSVKSEQFTTKNLLDIVTKDRAVIFYCNGIHCMGSSIAVKKAVTWGWTNVFYYRGGLNQWKQSQFPIETTHDFN